MFYYNKQTLAGQDQPGSIKLIYKNSPKEMLFEDTLNAGSAHNIYVHQVYSNYKFDRDKVFLTNKKKTKRSINASYVFITSAKKRTRRNGK